MTEEEREELMAREDRLWARGHYLQDLLYQHQSAVRVLKAELRDIEDDLNKIQEELEKVEEPTP